MTLSLYLLLDILYSLIDTFLSILRYISTHVIMLICHNHLKHLVLFTFDFMLNCLPSLNLVYQVTCVRLIEWKHELTKATLTRASCCYNLQAFLYPEIAHASCCYNPRAFLYPKIAHALCCYDPRVFLYPKLTRTPCCYNPQAFLGPKTARTPCC
jgi:hypothetical protein